MYNIFAVIYPLQCRITDCRHPPIPHCCYNIFTSTEIELPTSRIWEATLLLKECLQACARGRVILVCMSRSSFLLLEIDRHAAMRKKLLLLELLERTEVWSLP